MYVVSSKRSQPLSASNIDVRTTCYPCRNASKRVLELYYRCSQSYLCHLCYSLNETIDVDPIPRLCLQLSTSKLSSLPQLSRPREIDPTIAINKKFIILKINTNTMREPSMVDNIESAGIFPLPNLTVNRTAYADTFSTLSVHFQYIFSILSVHLFSNMNP